MVKELFKKLITDFIQRDIKDIVPREFNIPLESKKNNLTDRGTKKW